MARVLAVSWGLTIALTGVAGAEVRALLVGVSQYDEAAGLVSLRGPVNDVQLLRDVLTGRGVRDITILADGVAGGGIPTRAAILSEMAALAEMSAAGDLVLIHLSGHGTRQPDVSGDESDGLDEVFLPSDTARPAEGSNQIGNALTDDDIGAAVLAIRQTGADVWLIIDACHSGSGLRVGALDVAARFVDPALLGLSAVPRSTATEVETMVDGVEAPIGRVMAFYAARSSEVAVEVALAGEAGGAEQWYGLFTMRLAARLSGADSVSYRQLFQAVLADMNSGILPGGARLQTPSWEGNLADAVVLGGGDTVGLRQFAVTGDEVAAGQVHGFGEGTLVALVADATAGPDEVIGFAQMTDVGPVLAVLRAVAPDCLPRGDAPCPEIGPVPEAARFARLAGRPIDLVLRLAPPWDMVSGAVLGPDDPAVRALDAAIAEVVGSGEAQVVVDPAGFAVDIGWHGGRLWFAPRPLTGDAPVGLSWGASDGVALGAILVRIARAEELALMLTAVSESASALSPNPVAVAAQVVASRQDDLDPPGGPANPERECRRAIGAALADPAQPLNDAADLKQCDLVQFTATGTVPGARDVNRVHIDSQYCVHAAHTLVEGNQAVAALGDDMVMCSDCPGGYAAGDERLFIVVTESEDNAEGLNLEGLVETCGAPDASGTRGPEAAGAIAFLERMARRPDTRGAFGGLAIASVWVSAMRWRVLPRAEVFAVPQ